MKNQVLSISQMWYLANLGVNMATASMIYVPSETLPGDFNLEVFDKSKNYEASSVPAFTALDLINLLPKQMGNEEPDILFVNSGRPFDDESWEIGYRSPNKAYPLISVIYIGRLIDAAYQMLHFCIENNMSLWNNR